MKKLSDLEHRTQLAQTEIALQTEYLAWMRDHPLGDNDNFVFEKWMDEMPSRLHPIFHESISCLLKTAQ